MVKACIHCGEDVLEEGEKFCCKGCETAYEIINNLGFKNYYNIRQIKDSERKMKPELDDNLNLTDFISSQKPGEHSVSLLIQGLHCAACVWLIENILKRQENVTFVRINLTRKKLALSWKGNAQDGDKLIHMIQEIGYKLLPFDEEILKKEEKRYDNSILLALAVAGFGAGNVMLLSFSLWFSNFIDMGQEVRNLLHFFSSLIALPVIVFSSRIFFASAYKSIKAGYPNMDLAICLAITLSCLVSIFQSFKGSQHVYFDSAIMLVFFLLIGRYLELRIRKKAFAIASGFNLLSANYARIEIAKKVEIMPVKNLKANMILIVSAGEKILADGVIIDGTTEIDGSIITGENLPKSSNIGDKVFAGMINLSAPIKVKITKNSENSLLSKIVALSEEVENKKGHYVRMADKLARFYLPIVHILAFSTFAFYLRSSFDIAISNAVAVLIITCPCALALAVPIVQTIAISNLIKKGILVKSGEALEKLREAKTFIFDKTGSLTLGELKLLDIFLIQNGKLQKLTKDNKEEYLKYAASMAKNSKHPISKAISQSYNGNLENLQINEIQGFGLESKINSQVLKLGKKEFCEIGEVDNLDKKFSQTTSRLFMKYGDVQLVFLLEDQIKSDAKDVINHLKKLKKEIILLSGDEERSVKYLANQLKIKEFYFSKNPQEKMQILQKLQDANKKFIMIGDGLNDAPSLAMADISISFSKGSDLSQNIADIIIQGEKLTPIIALIKSAKKSIFLMKQNLIISLIYNLIAIPFAILGYIVPLFAAIAMSLSSILVLLNSLRMNILK